VFSEGAHERPGALQPIHPGGAVVAVGQEKGVGTSFFNQPLAARARWRRSLKAPGTRGLKQRRQRGPGELECLCLLLSLSLSRSPALSCSRSLLFLSSLRLLGANRVVTQGWGASQTPHSAPLHSEVGRLSVRAVAGHRVVCRARWALRCGPADLWG